ncbi:MAG: SH3 domain-containing protein [Desulfobulbaceae bacterium]|jgi:SH3-like domain-containing protein|nr:SH3 domain-containing protein [Desulfobulbaceae bacterium]
MLVVRNFSVARRLLWCGCVAWLLFFALPGMVQAKMVAVDRDRINVRSGPGTNYTILWHIDRGYPLQVIGAKGAWYRVRDFEDDVGWVYKPLTAERAHVVVKKPEINVRSGPGTNYRIVAKAREGVVFRTVNRQKGWVKVRHENGTTGWVARNLVWGW